jgi:hypothetical protein
MIELRVEGVPSGAQIKVLDQLPGQMEPELKEGDWIVLNFALWSAGDLNCVRSAVRAIMCNHNGATRLALRPFKEYGDIARWCPQYDQSIHHTRSPQWVIICNGQVRRAHGGPLTDDEITALFRVACNDAMNSLPERATNESEYHNRGTDRVPGTNGESDRDNRGNPDHDN